MSNRERDIIQSLARRAFLKKGSVGIGAAALAEMLAGETLAQSTFQQDLGILGATHHAPKAKAGNLPAHVWRHFPRGYF